MKKKMAKDSEWICSPVEMSPAGPTISIFSQASKEGRRLVAEVYGYEQAKPRSLLIAAAPNMEKALESVVLALEGRVHSHDALAALAEAREALAMAKGAN